MSVCRHPTWAQEISQGVAYCRLCKGVAGQPPTTEPNKAGDRWERELAEILDGLGVQITSEDHEGEF